MQDNSSNTNTILIVILILLVGGFAFYWYSHQAKPSSDTNKPALQINLGGSTNKAPDASN